MRAAYSILIASTLLTLSGLADSQTAGKVTDERIGTVMATQIEPLIKQQIAAHAVPGLAVAVVHDGKVVYMKGFGARKMGSPDPVTEDTVFQLASMSKPLSATVVASLVSKGLLTWDAKISDLDPDFRLLTPYPSSEVTVRDMFSHRSGLPGEAGNELEEMGYDQAQILHALRWVPPSSSFRAGYSYSNFCLTEGAVAAARTTGKPWAQVAEDELFRPLHMTSTSARYSDFLSRANRAELHVPRNGQWVPELRRTPDPQSPAGGASSSVRDLAEWVKMELADGGGLIKPDALNETHTPQIYRGQGTRQTNSFYGLGWAIDSLEDGKVRWGHAGAFTVGARTNVSLIPSEKLGIIVLTNAFPTGLPDAVCDEFLDDLFEGKSSRDWVTVWNGNYNTFIEQADAVAQRFSKPPTPAIPSSPDASLVGTYANDYVGKVTVRREGKGLVLELGPDKKPFPLTHFSGEEFLYFFSPEFPKSPSTATFTIGPDGKATGLILGDLEAAGNATLTRVP